MKFLLTFGNTEDDMLKKPEKKKYPLSHTLACDCEICKRALGYNEGLEDGLAYGKAYHDSRIKGAMEVYEKYKTPDGSISNQAWMMHASDIMHDMWRVIEDLGGGEFVILPKETMNHVTDEGIISLQRHLAEGEDAG